MMLRRSIITLLAAASGASLRSKPPPWCCRHRGQAHLFACHRHWRHRSLSELDLSLSPCHPSHLTSPHHHPSPPTDHGVSGPETAAALSLRSYPAPSAAPVHLRTRSRGLQSRAASYHSRSLAPSLVGGTSSRGAPLFAGIDSATGDEEVEEDGKAVRWGPPAAIDHRPSTIDHRPSTIDHSSDLTTIGPTHHDHHDHDHA